MKKILDYKEKFEKHISRTIFHLLQSGQQEFIRAQAFRYNFTFQELRKIIQAGRDLEMWAEGGLQDFWAEEELPGKNLKIEKEKILKHLDKEILKLQRQAKNYSENSGQPSVLYERKKIVSKKSAKNIFGECPVASPLTVCCNLKTLDSVQSCVYGCSYCSIQTFYSDEIILEEQLHEKLAKLELSPNRKYHIGTGQSSDALAYGNRSGMLDALCGFAEKNPHVLLEFKTKSANIDYFMQHKIPANVVCSWSLNPQIIIDNEEHFTSSLQERLHAARSAADNGVKVSFHFHPIIYYKDWCSAYTKIAADVIKMFNPQEVLFVSFGSLTFIKPVIKKIRELGLPSKILQMEFVTDPHGKLTYPDAIKIEKFSSMYKAFQSWHDKVFFYLCMEKASIWQESLGFVYETNSQFEQDLLDRSFAKIKTLE